MFYLSPASEALPGPPPLLAFVFKGWRLTRTIIMIIYDSEIEIFLFPIRGILSSLVHWIDPFAIRLPTNDVVLLKIPSPFAVHLKEFFPSFF